MCKRLALKMYYLMENSNKRNKKYDKFVLKVSLLRK